MISARFGRPVSASCSAWWRSWPVFSSTIRSARARPRASTCTSRKASSPSASQITSTRKAWTSGSESPAGSALVTVTVQRPSASTEIRLLRRSVRGDGAEARDRRGVSSTPRACGTRGRRRSGCGSRARRRARARASPRRRSGRRPTVRRIGSASNRPTIQPVARARRASIVRRDAAAAVDRGDDLEHLVTVAGGDDERAELAGVARVAEQLVIGTGRGRERSARRASRPCRGRRRSSRGRQ